MAVCRSRLSGEEERRGRMVEAYETQVCVVCVYFFNVQIGERIWICVCVDMDLCVCFDGNYIVLHVLEWKDGSMILVCHLCV